MIASAGQGPTGLAVKSWWNCRPWLRVTLGAVALAVLAACGTEEAGLAGEVPPPRALEAQAVGISSVRISWDRVSGANVAGYELQRRANLTGAFKTLASNIPQTTGRVTVFDNDVEPDTYYGYRVIALTSLGERSASSTVGGARTPPPPTLIVTVTTATANEAAADADGYVATLIGPRDTISTPMAPNGERRFTPLKAGAYSIVLRGLAKNCDFSSGDSLRTAQVADVGIVTETRVRFDVSCRDPRKGSLVVRYEQEGDTTDADGVRLVIAGLLDADPTDPARTYAKTETVNSRIASYRYDNLRSGQYEVAVEDVATLCTVQGLRKRTVAVKPLSLDTLRFNAVCARPIVVDTAGKPLRLEQQWSTASAPNGTKVSLTMTLDARALPSQRFSGISYDLAYSQTALRFDSSRKAEIGALAVNGRSNPGLVIVAGLETDPGGFGDKLIIGRLWFTVIGETGTSTRTSTTLKSLLSTAPSTEQVTKLSVQEATFTVGNLSTQNQPPLARANGPYTTPAGVALQLTAAGSSDPDGTIASYRWQFGDGTADATGESVQHTYVAAGTYTAQVTVTDDKGATASQQAQVTVAANGTTNQLPVARINAPATATPNSSVSFSGTGSTDADGTIQLYEWTFGDGSTGTGATATKVYAAAGTYTVSLKVTDNRGGTSTAQHTITVAAATSATPFTFSGTFGTVDPVTKFVDLTVTLDLSTDITETPTPEALGSYVVDSLKWDPAVLKLEAFNFGPGQQQAIDQSDVPKGKVRFSGNTLPGQNSGVITIARIRFRVQGAKGARTTTQTTVGPLLGTPATGSYNYRPKVDVREGTLVVP